MELFIFLGILALIFGAAIGFSIFVAMFTAKAIKQALESVASQLESSNGNQRPSLKEVLVQLIALKKGKKSSSNLENYAQVIPGNAPEIAQPKAAYDMDFYQIPAYERQGLLMSV
ncbi:hypothetical protein ACLS0R_03875 [Comamonas jiangduensis]|uniref:hypothetical protein n=1 Tax=Comamonas jiangduensis TaxID=1194168 RepID=UPI003BF7EF30